MTERAVDADAFNAFEAAGWEKQAATYEDLLGSITARLADPLLDAVEGGRDVRVLDIACGPGHVAATAASRGALVVGLDIAEAMLSRARRLHPELEFHQGDAEALRFADASFDAVVANFLLLHLGRPEQAVAELARVLAPGGRLALTVWDLPERAQFLGVIVDSLAAAGAAGLLEGAGLEDVSVRTVSFTHRAASPAELWRGLLGGTVRTSAIILRQTEEMQREIRTAFDEIVRRYEVDAQLELPVSVRLASARRPHAAR